MIFGDKKTADPAKGIELWTQAKSQGNVHAAYSLAMLELNGIHMPKNPKSGFMAIQDLALKKYPYAMVDMSIYDRRTRANYSPFMSLVRSGEYYGLTKGQHRPSISSVERCG